MKKIFIAFVFLSVVLKGQAQIYLSLPLERSVFQRSGSGDGSATIVIAGQVVQHPNPDIMPSSFSVKYRFIPLTKDGATSGSLPGWTVMAGSTPYGGLFYGSLSKATGWYMLQVGVFADGSSDPSLISSASVGVGEVVFIAGQSNAQGTEGITNDAVSSTYYDCVNSINDDGQFCKNTFKFPVIQKIQNGRYVTPNGNRSAWGFHYLGKKMVDGLVANKVVPVLFFNAAVGGTSVNNWRVTAYDPSATVSLPLTGYSLNACSATSAPAGDGPQGQPYKGLKTSLNYFGGMFGARGVIWHQGESDNYEATNTTFYQRRLDSLIDKTQIDFNSELKWAISKVSYLNGTTRTQVTTAQQNVKTGSNAAWTSTGAWTSDALGSTFRQGDNTHFNANGLVAVNDQYYTSYLSGNGYTALKGLTPVSAITAPNLTVVKSGSTVTLTAPSGAASYCWVENNGNVNSCYSTASSITVSNSVGAYPATKSYRCYIKNSTGNYTLSRAVNVPVWAVGGAYRVAAKEKEEVVVDEDKVMSLKVYPNPSKGKITTSFNLTEAANVRLQLLDVEGRLLSTIAAGPHAAGRHEYPVKTEHIPTGVYLSVLKVGELFITKKVVVNK